MQNRYKGGEAEGHAAANMHSQNEHIHMYSSRYAALCMHIIDMVVNHGSMLLDV